MLGSKPHSSQHLLSRVSQLSSKPEISIFHYGQMAKLSPGCMFEPNDEELIQDYLHPKVTGCKPLPSPCLVKECDLYGNMHPDQIWEQFKDSASGKKRVDLYFFITLKEKKKETNCITTLKKKKKTNYFNRTNEKGGTWSNEGSVVVYTTDTKQPIGIMRRFSYSNPSNPQQNGCWVMHEYSLDIKGSVLLPPSSNRSTSTHVLCRLRMKGKNKNISNSGKRKSLALSQPQRQPQLQAVHSNSNLKQPLCQALNSEHEQGGKTSIDDILKELEDAECNE